MKNSGFQSIIDVERYLSRKNPKVRDIALELRNLVAEVCPQATERILSGGLSYHNAAKGGPVRGAICQIEFGDASIRLSFIHGVRLKDPSSLLIGERKSKLFLQIDDFEEAPWEEIRKLIEEANALNPLDFGSLS